MAMFTVQTLADDSPTNRLLNARRLKCHFNQGIGTKWIESKPKTSPADIDEEILYDSIDIKDLSAREIMGNESPRDVKLLVNETGIHFLEMDKSVVLAALYITTVFPVLANNDEFLTVETRHVTVTGIPFIEQYFGTCKIGL
jgi:hypothetical protein